MTAMFLPFESDALAQAAARCLERRGLQQARVEEIAELAERPVEEVRQRLQNPVAAAMLVMESVVSGMEQALVDNTDEQSPLSERLMTLVLYELETLSSHRALVEELIFASFDPFAMELAADVVSTQAGPIRRYVSIVEAQIARARKAGEVGWWISPQIASVAFWTLHLRVIAAWLDAEDGTDPQLVGRVHKWILAFCRWLQLSPNSWFKTAPPE